MAEMDSDWRTIRIPIISKTWVGMTVGR